MSSIICPLQLAARKNPDHPLIISSNKVITYSQADRMATGIAARADAMGLKAGHRVGVSAFLTPEHIVFLMGLWRAKVVTALMNPNLPIQVLDQQLQDVHAKLLFMDSVLKLEESSSENVHPWRFDFDQPLTILLTSGTSARPKAVLHAWGNHYHSALGSNEWIPFGGDDRWFLTLPLHHVSGLSIVFRALAAGATIVMGDYKRFELAAQEGKITHASLVATQLYRLMQNPKHIPLLKQLKAILLGGSAIPQTLIDQAVEHQLPIHISYGSTETAAQAATSVRIVSVDDRRKVSVLKYRQIKIKDGGEILVKGETLFKGYVSGDLLMQPFDKDGWFATGDLGELSAEGYLRVIGRKDNMFISGGENIHPEEIESILCQHPLIEDAVVVPVEDREFGERPLAFVKFKPGQLLNGRQLTEHLSQFLPKFKIPKQFLSWQEDPAYPAVKPSRRYFQSLANEMGEMGEEGAA